MWFESRLSLVRSPKLGTKSADGDLVSSGLPRIVKGIVRTRKTKEFTKKHWAIGKWLVGFIEIAKSKARCAPVRGTTFGWNGRVSVIPAPRIAAASSLQKDAEVAKNLCHACSLLPLRPSVILLRLFWIGCANAIKGLLIGFARLRQRVYECWILCSS